MRARRYLGGWETASGPPTPLADAGLAGSRGEVGNGPLSRGTQLGLTGPVAVDNGLTEVTGLGADVVEELATRRGLRDLMGHHEASGYTDGQKHNSLHRDSPFPGDLVLADLGLHHTGKAPVFTEASRRTSWRN